ncbi:MAG TPA: DUF1559 domain-containing protein [Pirellulales bacterium]
MNEDFGRGPDFGNEGNPPARSRSVASTVIKVFIGIGIAGVVVAMLLPAVRSARPAAFRNSCSNNLKQIAIAILDYADKYHELPPAYTTDANGKPLHSWRTLILPFIEERRLYESINLTKPWDDPANAKALNTHLSAYTCPASTGDPDNRTTYLAVVTPTSCLQPSKSKTLSDITDGVNKTLMVIEVDTDHAVPWMAPIDADENVVVGIGPNSKLAHDSGFTAAFVDGHVEFLFTDLPAAQRRALISAAGNDNAALEGEK